MQNPKSNNILVCVFSPNNTQWVSYVYENTIEHNVTAPINQRIIESVL